MTTTAICVVALFALLGFGSLVQAMKEVLVARALPPTCPCRDIASVTLTPGATFELPPGTKLQPATEADPTVLSYTQRPKETVNLHPDLTTSFATEATEGVADAFQDTRDAVDSEKARALLTNDLDEPRLQGEILLLKVNVRRLKRGLPAIGIPRHA